MNTPLNFFSQNISEKSAAYIKYLRIERQLDFIKVYELSSREYKELKTDIEFDKNSTAALGHTLCTATMNYLNDFENVDNWFW
jgi:hypothetical protein